MKHSLPPQHIYSLEGATRTDVYHKLGRLCELRLIGHFSEEQIAERLGFGSTEAMYQQLRTWGLSGLVSHAHEEPRSPRKRKARTESGEEAEELPSVDNGAAELFRETLESLIEAVGSLRYLRETYKDKLFDATYKQTNPVLYRSLFPNSQDWEKLREEYGTRLEDIDDAEERKRIDEEEQERLIIPGSKITAFEGATHVPQDLWVTLISTYVLLGRPLEALINAVHRNPHEADIQAIHARAYQGERSLQYVADQLARLVRGGSVERGAPRPNLSPAEQREWWEKFRKKGAE